MNDSNETQNTDISATPSLLRPPTGGPATDPPQGPPLFMMQPDPNADATKHHHHRSKLHVGPILWQMLPLAVVVAVIAWALWRMDVEAFVAAIANAGPLPFFAALSILPALGVPTTPLFLLAGAAFGNMIGLAGSGVSILLNLLLSYWLARTYLRSTLERVLLVRFRKSLPNLTRTGAIRFAVLVKLMPGVPTFFKNYLVGIADVPAAIYFTVLWPLTMLYAAAVIVLGDSLHDRDHNTTIAAVVVLVVLAIALKLARQRWKERDDEASDTDDDTDPETRRR